MRAARCAAALAALIAWALAGAPAGAADGAAPPPTRVEARSANFLAVGVVRGDTLSIHLTRALDNAPVPDAVLGVTLRGKSYATTAQADGSYTLQAPELTLPGKAAVEFKVEATGGAEKLATTMEIVPAGAATADATANARQLGWWVLNFGVCIGFLVLMSRRRKRAAENASGSDPGA